MADTVAVMNAGRIEQLGAPMDLYESPVTTFVANFLGQSNLLPGRVLSTAGGTIVVDVHGQGLRLPAERNRCSNGDLLVGVRPEKIRLSHTTDEPSGATADTNRLTGGVVLDASFAGVSMQYVVRMPWGQELTVFAQNLHLTERFGPGTAVDLVWEPAHTFGLDGDATAGVVVDGVPVGAGVG